VERAALALIGLIEEVAAYPMEAVTAKTAFNQG
jgi:hypothetical protein